jgi:ABC-type multidrug transport system ATPase subunit
MIDCARTPTADATPARSAPRAQKHVTYWLKRVNLATPSTRRKTSRKYSGGMKRRLSVACSLVANPRLVYLDEPSTGLDPESRRQLWSAIRAAKRDKSLILTTHALEEADALCDRIGIMTLGQMRVLGSPTELRMRFDEGYKLSLAAPPSKQDELVSLIMGLTSSQVG